MAFIKIWNKCIVYLILGIRLENANSLMILPGLQIVNMVHTNVFIFSEPSVRHERRK